MPRINFRRLYALGLLREARGAWAYAFTKDSDSIAGDDAEIIAMKLEDEAFAILEKETGHGIHG